MFFNKSKNSTNIDTIVKEPNYWEINSYLVFPMKDEEIKRDTIIKNLEKNKDLKLLGIAEPSDEKDGRLLFEYKKNKFEVFYYFNKFKLPGLLDYQVEDFTDEELKELTTCSNSLVLFMDTKELCKLRYKLQLTIGSLILDKVYAVLDESSEKVLHPSLVNMIVNSKYLPSDDLLYTIQVIVDNKKVWLHTHGLSRFGFPEVEILDSNLDIYKEQYSIITTLVNHLFDKGPVDNNIYLIGYLNNDFPFFITLIPWQEAIKKYDDLTMGGLEDRQYEHNTNYKVIFTYESEDKLDNNEYSKLSIFDNIIGNDPLFLLSNTETNRISLVAQEQFKYVKNAIKNENNSILIKVGIVTDPQTNNREHLWFELVEIIDDNHFKGKLVNKPFDDIDMVEGEIYTFEVNQITDWIIYMDDKTINPDTVYKIK